MPTSNPTGRSGDLEGTVVLVCGAGSSGEAVSNGEAAARTYARAGAAVACLDRDSDEAERVAAEIAAEGGTALALTADVCLEDDVARAVRRVAEVWAPPAGLHNNVGAPVVGDVRELDRERWDQALAVNLTSCYLTVRHVLPAMLDAGRGAIVNVSSTASIRATGYTYPAYSAAKAGVNQLTVSLALTYADRGIRVNAVLPGLIDTPLVGRSVVEDATALDEQRAARAAASPTGRMGSPWDVAEAALFLMSDRAAYVNGVLLPVDGGLSARST
ncbi:SDR family NAD(P)-dependent oxidoreductase [uncultured Nocardioides sp.]|uniref:SDR family NAD(P)-dependent oxidoreductase n=1 Tax=uncultured Nocardioides sp. TaxID=198441 RepID=UPI002604A435|nr:SDR family NAD(P)-dependent oxidoreductase [uncultured Nocardioides sp.]